MKSKYLLTVICCFLFLSNCFSQLRTKEEYDKYFAPYGIKLMIDYQIADSNFYVALHSLDSLIKVYPHDPDLHRTEGYVYHAIGDTILSKVALKNAIDRYKFLNAQRWLFQDEMNIAWLINLIYGNAALQDYLDMVEQKKEYKKEKHENRLSYFREDVPKITLDKAVEDYIIQYSLMKEEETKVKADE